MFIEGEVPYISGGNNGGMWGGDGIWAILLLALLGFGNRGYGYGGGSGSEMLGYELGKVATTNDVASGFNNSALLGNQNEIKLAMTQGFAGLNTVIGQGFSSTSHQISDCCCRTQAAIADLKYANESQTCQIITNQNANTQRIIDYLTNEKIESLRAENVALKGRISNNEQSAYIINALNPQARPAYIVPNPNCCYGGCGASIQ